MSATSPDRLLQRRAAIVGAVLLLFVVAGAVLLWPSGSRPDLVVAPEPGSATLSKGTEVAVLRIRSGRRPTSVGLADSQRHAAPGTGPAGGGWRPAR